MTKDISQVPLHLRTELLARLEVELDYAFPKTPEYLQLQREIGVLTGEHDVCVVRTIDFGDHTTPPVLIDDLGTYLESK